MHHQQGSGCRDKQARIVKPEKTKGKDAPKPMYQSVRACRVYGVKNTTYKRIYEGRLLQ
jgi:hypothetical protein